MYQTCLHTHDMVLFFPKQVRVMKENISVDKILIRNDCKVFLQSQFKKVIYSLINVDKKIIE